MQRVGGASLLVVAMVGGCAAQPGQARRAAEPKLLDGEQYCAAWVLRNMQVACVEPMSAERASHKTSYVKLTVQGGRATRLEFQNGAGGYLEDSSGDVGFVLEYDARGSTHKWFNRWGRTTAVWRYDGLTATRLTPWGTPKQDRPEDAYRHVFTLDARGFAVNDKAVDVDGRQARRGGIHETRIVRDDAGRSLERAFFDVDGSPTTNEAGIHRLLDRYDGNGCQVESASFDAADRPFAGASGWSRAVRTCDAFANPLTMRWYDPTGMPQIDRAGIHGWTVTLDAHGGCVMRVNVGLDGRPAPANAREAIARYRLDARGDVVEASYLGPNGEPSVLPEGHSGQRWVRHENGAILRIIHVDTNGQPVTIRAGYAQEVHAFDAKGNLVARRFLDASGAPARAATGEAAVAYAYDAHALMSELEFLDAAGHPVNIWRGYAKQTFTRNESGIIVSRAHFDADGNAVALAGAREMGFTYHGVDVPRPASLTREEAQRRANDAIRRLGAGETWIAVARQLADWSEDEPVFGVSTSWYPPIWEALAKLSPGDAPVLIDTPRGFIVVERKQ